MNKEELVQSVAQQTCTTKKTVQAVIDSVIETVESTVKNGGTVTLVGFGTFSAKARNARTCRNPQTGEEIHVDAKTVPAFKAGKKFKELVNA